ncbi:monovalent cation/H(+) antiporter subunit G [Orrella marina]|uniref:Sodium:proton antiporter n=1 Tax=Orrella marina TaxID=2163011 RepID=A0A2R4XLF3_9BURK|nr:monovalent cation/H(+) antiporter subunit G [Orrella marina]AWB34613.1 sodium:proton antiporter [Orrella marina]
MILGLISDAMLATGAAFVVIGAFGVIRMPDLYTRMHASSVTETLGMLLVMVGLLLTQGWSLATFKLFAIAVFLLFTAPVASYAMANAALISGVKPKLAHENDQETLP